MTFIILAIVALFAILGVPLFVVLGTAVAMALYFSDIPLVVMAQRMFTTTDSFPLMAIPFFILAGALMTKGGIARRLIDLAKAAVGWLPSGLAIATVAACMLFAAISGSSPATLVAVGTLMYPAMLRDRYSQDFSLGLVTTAGSLGILIPPSIPMIIYAIVVGVSVSDLFIAGVGPGLLIGALLMTYSFLRNRGGSQHRIPFSKSAFVSRFKEGIWAVLLPVVILGGIYGGIFTATEAAAVAVIYAFGVEVFIHRETKLKKIPEIFVGSAVDMGIILVIIAIAMSLSWFLTAQYVPQLLAEWISDHIHTPWVFLLALNLLLLVTGCLMDIISAILILAPLTAPIAREMGVDPIHLGILYIVNLEIGYLTPPIGINLFVSSIVFDKPVVRVIRAVLPFLAVMLLGLLLVTYFPQISLALVHTLK
ncbi:MAG: TRAP transporter large permease subunit [Deltaproteobacteria bacterium]|nr:TRAP transporter large permease subunit [Deltaproteobacteria bacterium]